MINRMMALLNSEFFSFENLPCKRLRWSSSVLQPAFEMGRRAARLFIEHIHAEGKPDVETIVLKPQLVVRASSMKK